MLSFFRKLLGKRRALIAIGVIVLLWVLFLDSHSVLNRVRWHMEAERLAEKNAEMQTLIREAEQELERRDDDDEIERIARESYGMRREGETVYKVAEESN
jgi:cell division protein FtsB